jgi:hypothetical protein
MKLISFPQFSISLILLFIREPGMILSKTQHYSTQNTIEGIWLGELEIPNAAKLRMGIIISKTNDNSYKAILDIIDQATGDIPCDEVIYRYDSVIVRIKGLGIEIAGVADPEYKSIKSEFRQGGGILTVFFNRVEKLPGLLRPQEPQNSGN